MCHQMSSVTKVSPSSKLCHPLSLMFVNAVSTVFLNTEFRHSMVTVWLQYGNNKVTVRLQYGYSTSDVMKIALISIF